MLKDFVRQVWVLVMSTSEALVGYPCLDDGVRKVMTFEIAAYRVLVPGDAW